VLVLLPIWIDYLNGCSSARGFGITAQIKIMGEPSLTCTCQILPTFKKVQDYFMKEEKV
jgi:hypothetical protein